MENLKFHLNDFVAPDLLQNQSVEEKTGVSETSSNNELEKEPTVKNDKFLERSYKFPIKVSDSMTKEHQFTAAQGEFCSDSLEQPSETACSPIPIDVDKFITGDESHNNEKIGPQNFTTQPTSECQLSAKSCSTSDNYEQSSDCSEVRPRTFKEKLMYWIVKTKQKIMNVQDLLKILKPDHPELPLSYVTLFKTKHLDKLDVKPFGTEAFFVYIGILRQLKNILKPDLHENDSLLLLQGNIDGMPPWVSSKWEFWPILMRVIFGVGVYKIFPVAIYYGKKTRKS